MYIYIYICTVYIYIYIVSIEDSWSAVLTTSWLVFLSKMTWTKSYLAKIKSINGGYMMVFFLCVRLRFRTQFGHHQSHSKHWTHQHFFNHPPNSSQKSSKKNTPKTSSHHGPKLRVPFFPALLISRTISKWFTLSVCRIVAMQIRLVFDGFEWQKVSLVHW